MRCIVPFILCLAILIPRGARADVTDFSGFKFETDVAKTWDFGLTVDGRYVSWIADEDAWRMAMLLAGWRFEPVKGFALTPIVGIVDDWGGGGHDQLLVISLWKDMTFRGGGLTFHLEGNNYVDLETKDYSYEGRYSMDARIGQPGSEERPWNLWLGPQIEQYDLHTLIGAHFGANQKDSPFRLEAAYNFGLHEEVRGHSLRFSLTVIIP